MSRLTYRHTIAASYLGYITQAIVNNLAPLLFVTFMSEFSLTLEQITLMTTVNFAVQLLVDLLSAKLVDRIGYRVSIVAAHVLAVLGLSGMAILPGILPPMTGLMIAVVLYAIGGGMIEVLISPIVEACPTEGKSAAMSLLHSFYCWGHVALVLLSTLFFAAFGTANWRVLTLLWMIVPIANAVYFSFVPLYPIVPEEAQQMPMKRMLTSRVFWLLMVMMVCAGASEQAMSQWASTFAEDGLHITKTMGDLLGPCAFAVTMGTARALYGKFADKLPLRTAMIASSILCIVCYIVASQSGNALAALLGCALCGFSVGIFWPGTFSLAALALPGAGTAMYRADGARRRPRLFRRPDDGGSVFRRARRSAIRLNRWHDFPDCDAGVVCVLEDGEEEGVNQGALPLRPQQGFALHPRRVFDPLDTLLAIELVTRSCSARVFIQ